jgi:hypothetical protein
VDKDYSLDGKDRPEWDRLWSARTRRLLPGPCHLDLGNARSSQPLAAVSIADDPSEFAGRIYRCSEVCPVCGDLTAGRLRVAATLDVTFESGVSFGVGVWAHRACFEACHDTEIPAPIPW